MANPSSGPSEPRRRDEAGRPRVTDREDADRDELDRDDDGRASTAGWSEISSGSVTW